jgi:hypothetical protein
MLKLLVKPSEIFLRFILGLHLALSKPQERHLLRIGEAIVLCQEKKTLSSLYRMILDAPDVSAAADFLRESPWDSTQVRKSIEKFTIEYALRQAGCMPSRCGAPTRPKRNMVISPK